MFELLTADAPGSLSRRFRANRFAFFERVSGLAPGMTVLDVGGTPWSSFFGSRPEYAVVYLNLMPGTEVVSRILDGHRYVQGDARSLPFADGQFDIVFSNSLIEHIPVEAREQVAREMLRVGRFLFVQVPYRYFPWEPHYNFPLAQFLPVPMKAWLGRYWLLSHRRGQDIQPDENLPSRRELARLFPVLTITAELVGPLTKALYAWGRR
jgi:hypothetical protein